MGAVITLSRFASEADHADLASLQEASRGAAPECLVASPSPDQQADSRRFDQDNVLDAILHHIDERALAGSIGAPIDGARLAFNLSSVTVDNDAAFFETIEAFYIHLCRHISGAPIAIPDDSLRDDAHALLDDAYTRYGGVTAAIAEGREGVRGGMRRVLDEMTECFKKERMGNRVRAVLKESLAGMNWEGKLSLAHVLLQRLEPGLPGEDRKEKTEQCAHHDEELLQAYAASMDEMKGRLSAL